jgi:MraZ protein
MMRRRFHARSHDESLDSAGRVRLPQHLIDHAGLEGACMIVGVDDHLEVWDPARWAEHDAEIDAKADNMAESLAAGTGEDR